MGTHSLSAATKKTLHRAELRQETSARDVAEIMDPVD